jgi:predicted HTH domain antitoxin
MATREEMVEVHFRLPVGNVPEKHQQTAAEKAKAAYVLELLRQGDISAGRAAELLNVSRWELSNLMSTFGISAFDETITSEELQAEVKSALKDFEESPS